MLVLSRGVGEQIVIGEGAERVLVMVTAIRRGKVRLGITAPKQIPVHREEVQAAIERQRKEASGEQGTK